MNQTSQPLRKRAMLFFALCLTASAVTVALRIVNYFFFFDSEIGYFVSGAALPIVDICLIFASLVGLAVFAVVGFRKKSLGYGRTTPVAVRVGAAFAALGFLWLTVTDVIAYAANTAATSGLLAILFSFGGVLYFLLIAAGIRQESYLLLTVFLAILRMVVSLGSSYLKLMAVPMNAPDKVMFQLAILGAMLFLVNEIRALVSSPRSAVYMISSACAMVLLSVGSIPALVGCLCGRLNTAELLSGFGMELGLFLYVTLRLLCLCLAPTPESEEAPAAEVVAEEAVDKTAKTAEEPIEKAMDEAEEDAENREDEDKA